MNIGILLFTTITTPLVWAILSNQTILEIKKILYGRSKRYIFLYATLLVCAYLLARFFVYLFLYLISYSLENFYPAISEGTTWIIFASQFSFWALINRISLLRKDNIVAKLTLYHIAEMFWILAATLIIGEVTTLRGSDLLGFKSL